MPDDFELRVGLADLYGTCCTVGYSPADDDGGGMISITLECGVCAGRGYPTVEAARRIAAALLDAADRLDAEA